MRLIPIFAIVLSMLSLLAVAGQPYKGPPLTLDGLHPDRVLIGDPNLVASFKGRVVVIGSLPCGHLFELPKSNSSSSRERGFAKSQEEAREKTELKARPFRAEFSRLYERLDSNPNVLCVGAINLGDRRPISKAPDLAAAVNRAKQLKVACPIIEIWAEEATFGQIMTLAYVMVFDSTGTLCYNGEIGSDCDKAIRAAVKKMAP